MKTKIYFWFGLFFCGFIAASNVAAAHPRAEHVFIISFDQGNPDLMDKDNLPTVKKMVAKGAHTWTAYTTLPSLTLPSHTSMLTGVGPQKHQVLWNNYAPEKGFVKVPTIFGIAKEHHLVTAMFVGKERFKQLAVPGTVDVFVWPQPADDAKTVAGAFAEQVKTLRPNLCFIHFRDADTVGHLFGADSQEKIAAMKDCDSALKIVQDAVEQAGLSKSSVFIMTADHGSHNTKDSNGKTVGAHDVGETADVLIPWIAFGKGVKKNFTVTATVLQYDTAATALWLLGIPVPEDFWGKPVTSAFE
ncbi:MAG: alkaline phosphatase family protein [Verrucomicrobiota bacterium]